LGGEAQAWPFYVDEEPVTGCDRLVPLAGPEVLFPMQKRLDQLGPYVRLAYLARSMLCPVISAAELVAESVVNAAFLRSNQLADASFQLSAAVSPPS
jgi:hypothetical protein